MSMFSLTNFSYFVIYRCFSSLLSHNMKDVMDIPKDKTYPDDSVQCHGCGGHGCQACDDRGWLTPRDHSDGRQCEYSRCKNPILPAQFAVYCSSDCAEKDAQVISSY